MFCYTISVHRVQKYRLYPTEAQAEKLAEFASVTRFIYNLALEQRRDFWRQYKRATGRTLNYASQGRQLTQLRRENDWIKAVPANCQHGALQDLDKAFATFFRGGGFPRFRKAGIHESFEVKAADSRVRPLSAKFAQAFVPKIGWIKYRDTRPLEGSIRSTRFVCEKGAWFVCIGVRLDYEPPQSDLPAIGIDRGVTLALACSNGDTFKATDLQDLDRQTRKAQRVLSRRKRGSNRYRKQRQAVASLKAKAARIRRDWQHKATTQICRHHGAVVIEDLKTRNMTRAATGKRGLNRAILNIGWHSIETMLAYKLEERGGTLIKINPAYTSQTCSACGAIDKQSRESQARFACTSCGHEMNADHNAAINILRQGLPVVDERGCASDETRTVNLRAA